RRCVRRRRALEQHDRRRERAHRHLGLRDGSDDSERRRIGREPGGERSVSVMMDALRRDSRGPAWQGEAGGSARTDSVLNMLGYQHRSRGWSLKTLLLYGALAAGAGFVALAVLITILTPSTPPSQNPPPQRTAESPPAQRTAQNRVTERVAPPQQPPP